jgi:Transcriptional regulatory protein, C terminal
VPAARLTLHQTNGDRERNGGKAELGEAEEEPVRRAVTAPGDGKPLLRADPASGGTVLDMDPELVRDVLARVQELLAQAKADANEPAPEASEPDDIAIDLPTQTVWRSGRPIRVSPTEFRLLVALVRRRGAVVSREALRRDVWPGGTEVQSRVIDTHIARLRRKLEDNPKRPRHILTALAAGYRFLA